MIGIENPNNEKLFYHFSLEKKVRKNHPLRKFKDMLNLDFMYYARSFEQQAVKT